MDKILNRDAAIQTAVDATTLFHSWFYAAQRDFTYTSMCGSYTPIASVLRQTVRRAFAIVDFPDPEINVSGEDVDAIMSEIKKLPAREGLRDIFDGLRMEGWDVYAVTNGGKEGSLKYFELANVQLDEDHLLSCDDIKVAKPDPKVYENANQWLESRGCEASAVGKSQEAVGQRWFVAAHSWDLTAAKKAGFRTAWVAHEEHDPCNSLFGEFDIHAKDLKECLEKMKAAD